MGVPLNHPFKQDFPLHIHFGVLRWMPRVLAPPRLPNLLGRSAHSQARHGSMCENAKNHHEKLNFRWNKYRRPWFLLNVFDFLVLFLFKFKRFVGTIIRGYFRYQGKAKVLWRWPSGKGFHRNSWGSDKTQHGLHFSMARSLIFLLVACQTFVKSDPHFEESITILASIVALVGQAPLSPGVNLKTSTRRKKHCQMHSSCRFSDRLLLLLRGIQWIFYWLVVDLPLWKIWVRQLGWSSSQLGKIEFMFQTTNQYILYIYHLHPISVTGLTMVYGYLW